MFAYTYLNTTAYCVLVPMGISKFIKTIVAMKTGIFLHYVCKITIGLPSMVQIVTKQMLCSRSTASLATIFVT